MLQHQPARVLERMSIAKVIGLRLLLATEMNVAKELTGMSEKLSEHGAKAMSATAEASMRLQEMGRGLTDEGKWYQLRCLLGWHRSAPSRVRHLYYGHAKPTVEEMDQIRRAHLRQRMDSLLERRDEDRKLLDSLRRDMEALQASDPDFYCEQIEALRETACRLEQRIGRLGDEAGGLGR